MPSFFDLFPLQLVALVVGACILRVYLKGKQYRGRESAKGKVAIVTGANCGIGKQVARELNYRGAKVYMGCRSLEKGQQAVKELTAAGCSFDRLIVRELDLSSFASVREFAKFIAEKESGGVDILVNNAGVMLYPKFKLTEDGHELTWQTNYLSHFLLTQLLLPVMQKTKDPARIVNVAAPAHSSVSDFNLDTIDRREGWDSRDAFSRSKLAMILHVGHLTSILRREGSHLIINACNPGFTYTRIIRHTPLSTNPVLRAIISPLAWFFLKTPKDGAQCIIYAAMAKELQGVSGKYFSECKPKDPSELGKDFKLSEQLYQYSMGACGL
jgi:NAD(P)-dependent dehydrogenase (short-subunit alcohol dehydrogenase family)